MSLRPSWAKYPGSSSPKVSSPRPAAIRPRWHRNQNSNRRTISSTGLCSQRGNRKVVPEVVRLDAQQKSARAQDAEHFPQGIQRTWQMHQHCLARDYVERVVGQRQIGGVALLKTQQFCRNLREGAAEVLRRFADPSLLSIHSCKPRRRAEIRVELARPMAETAADIGQGRSFTQPPARRHQIEKVPMP